MTQRARLFAALLDDLYGAQLLLLASGVVPPRLVFGNPHFLRPCHATPRRQFPLLSFYGADLLRGTDGRWRVLADRCGGVNGWASRRRTGCCWPASCRRLFGRRRCARCAPSTPWPWSSQAPAPEGAADPRIALLDARLPAGNLA